MARAVTVAVDDEGLAACAVRARVEAEITLTCPGPVTVTVGDRREALTIIEANLRSTDSECRADRPGGVGEMIIEADTNPARTVTVGDGF